MSQKTITGETELIRRLLQCARFNLGKCKKAEGKMFPKRDQATLDLIDDHINSDPDLI